MDGADDGNLVVFGHALVDTLGDLVIDEEFCETADFKKVDAIGQAGGGVVDLFLAHGRDIDGDPPGAALGHDAPSKLTTVRATSQASLTAPFSALGKAAFKTMAT